MKTNGALLTGLALTALAMLGGCNQPSPGTTRMLGEVEYPAAFAAGREVMSQYFSIAKADPDTGVIKSRPETASEPNERLLGGSPARKVATLRVYREEGQIAAHASVAVQREGSAGHRQMSRTGEDYSGAPTQTPAELEAATTPEQNEVWRTERYDHALERQMLADIHRSLHPGDGG